MGTPLLDARGAIELAKKTGFQGVDLRVSDNKGEVLPTANTGDLKEIKILLDDNGIQLAGLLCYNKTGTQKESSWQEMEDSLKRHMDIGCELGSPSIRMFGGNPLELGELSRYIDASAKVIKKVCDANKHIKIYLQNHGGSYTFAQAMTLQDKVDDKGFSQVFSPDHCLMMGEDLSTVYENASKYSSQIYLSDVIKKHDQGNDPKYMGILPGQGEVPLKESILALGPDYDAWVTFKWEKIWQDHLQEPQEAFPFFMDYIKELI